MEPTRAALLAVYFPIIILATAAAYLYFRGVLVPAMKSGSLTIRDHGLAICLVLGLTGDMVESTYYGVMRIWNAYHGTVHYTVTPSFGIKVTILATSIIGLASYYSIVSGKNHLWRVIFAAVGIWMAAFLGFYLTR